MNEQITHQRVDSFVVIHYYRLVTLPLGDALDGLDDDDDDDGVLVCSLFDCTSTASVRCPILSLCDDDDVVDRAFRLNANGDGDDPAANTDDVVPSGATRFNFAKESIIK
jgi:hypothetical protein